MLYTVGDRVTLTFTVTESSPTVTASTLDPEGVSTPLTVTPGADGVYTATFRPAEAGRYTVVWRAVDSEGMAVGAMTDVVNVHAADTGALISLADAREHLNIPAGVTVEDEELRGFIAAATVAVEHHLGRAVARRTITEYHSLDCLQRRMILNWAPVLSVTSVESVDGVRSWAPADIDVDAVTGVLEVLRGGGLFGRLRVVYVAGERVVPQNVVLATQIVVAHLWQTQRVQTLGRGPGFGQGGGFGEDSSAPVGLGFALPNRAIELLGSSPPAVA